MRLSFGGRFLTGHDRLDVNLRDLLIAPHGGTQILYAATGSGGGVTSYRITPASAPMVLDAGFFSAGLSGLHDPDLGLVGDTLVIGGTRTGRLLGLRAPADGTLHALPDLAEASAPVTGWAGTGTLSLITEATQPLAGDAHMATLRIGGRDIILGTSTGTAAVISFAQSSDGSLTELDRADALDGLGLSQPSAIKGFSAHGLTWVIVGSAGTGSIALMRLDADGRLTPTDHVMDTRDTRFGQVQALEVVNAGAQAFVLAGGTDDGLSLFSVTPDGQLVLRDTRIHSQGAGLENITDIAATQLGDQIRAYVTSAVASGISQYSFDISGLGAVRQGTNPGAEHLTGTAGDDILQAIGADTLMAGNGDDILIGGAGAVLSGGAGGDIFVVDGPGHVRITDFNPTADRLDLSRLPMLRDPAQLNASTTASGITLTYRDSRIDITGAQGPLSLQDLFANARFLTPDRLAIIPSDPEPAPAPAPQPAAPPAMPKLFGGDGQDVIAASQQADEIWGRAGNDSITAGAGRDRVFGGAGDDTISAGDGFDLIKAGSGNDNLRGDRGNDTLMGFTGDDLIRGGDDHDTLIGEAGRDRLLGEHGHDLLSGNAGRDTLDGGIGNDTLRGGAEADHLTGANGADQLFGGSGADTLDGGLYTDTLQGGLGADQLFGGRGDDLLVGMADRDRLKGEAGHDILRGGAGNDTVAGGAGHDHVEGNAGHDRLQGNAGNDTLIGGTGNDRLLGGIGADQFVFASGFGRDTISDFDPTQDSILFHDIAPDQLSITDLGDHSLILTGRGSLYLRDVSADQLLPSLFDFDI